MQDPQDLQQPYEQFKNSVRYIGAVQLYKEVCDTLKQRDENGRPKIDQYLEAVSSASSTFNTWIN